MSDLSSPFVSRRWRARPWPRNRWGREWRREPVRHLSRVMAALWCVLFVVSAAAPSPHCTPLDPSVCAPDQGLAVFGSLLLAAPVLLLWLPSVGALVTLAWGLAAQTTTLPVLPKLLWLALGLACLSLPLLQRGGRPWGLRPWRQRRPSWRDASHHLHAEQGALASGISHSAELIGFPVLHREAPSRWQRLPNGVRLSTRATVVALLAFGSTVSFLWYAHDTAAERRHLDHSHVVTGQVVGYDDPKDPIDIVVGLPSGRRAQIEVAETDIYPVGRQVPVHVDPTDASWAELVAEPNDSTFFLDAGGALALLAIVAGVQAARRLL